METYFRVNNTALERSENTSFYFIAKAIAQSLKISFKPRSYNEFCARELSELATVVKDAHDIAQSDSQFQRLDEVQVIGDGVLPSVLEAIKSVLGDFPVKFEFPAQESFARGGVYVMMPHHEIVLSVFAITVRRSAQGINLMGGYKQILCEKGKICKRGPLLFFLFACSEST
jgi:hypothetical protein